MIGNVESYREICSALQQEKYSDLREALRQTGYQDLNQGQIEAILTAVEIKVGTAIVTGMDIFYDLCSDQQIDSHLAPRTAFEIGKALFIASPKGAK